MPSLTSARADCYLPGVQQVPLDVSREIVHRTEGSLGKQYAAQPESH